MSHSGAKGPLKILLQSASGQYAFLGVSVYALFPEQVKELLGPIIKKLLDGASSKNLLEQYQNSPNIIIHTGEGNGRGRGGSGGRSGLVGTMGYMLMGAGACWAFYMVVSTADFIPDMVKELLPVTRLYFEQTTQKLGRGIVGVKTVLEERILGLSRQQDELSKKQNETHKDVLMTKDEIERARMDLALMGSTLDRNTQSLESTQDMQTYTTRGIKLLVRTVATFLPDQSSFLGELAQFVEDGAQYLAEDSGRSASESNCIETGATTDTEDSDLEDLPGLVGSVPTSTLLTSPRRSLVANQNLKDLHELLGR